MQPSPASIAQPAAIGDGWDVTSLEAAGMDRRPIEAMTAEIRRYSDWNIHAVLIEHEGRLVYEEYFAGEDQKWSQNLGPVVFTRDTKHDLRSITKSVTSALVGITLASGKIRSLDQLLLDFFPEHAAASGQRERPRISLRHALMMSAGLDWNEDLPYTDPRNDENVMTFSEDPMGYVLTRPGVAEPGAVWRYNGGLPQVLAMIVQRATGERLRDYARRVLFAPLGITDFEWLGNLAGVPAAASGPTAAAPRPCQVRLAVPARWPVERMPGRAGGLGARIHGEADCVNDSRQCLRYARLRLSVVAHQLLHGGGNAGSSLSEWQRRATHLRCARVAHGCNDACRAVQRSYGQRLARPAITGADRPGGSPGAFSPSLRGKLWMLKQTATSEVAVQ